MEHVHERGHIVQEYGLENSPFKICILVGLKNLLLIGEQRISHLEVVNELFVIELLQVWAWDVLG